MLEREYFSVLWSYISFHLLSKRLQGCYNIQSALRFLSVGYQPCVPYQWNNCTDFCITFTWFISPHHKNIHHRRKWRISINGLGTSCFTRYPILLHFQRKKKVIKLTMETGNAQYIRKMHIYIYLMLLSCLQIHFFCFLHLCCFIRNYYLKIFKILNNLYNYFSDPIIAIFAKTFVFSVVKMKLWNRF